MLLQINEILTNNEILKNSILLDYDYFILTDKLLDEIISSFHTVIITSNTQYIINRYKIKYRRNRNILVIYRSALKTDVRQSIDILLTNNFDEKLKDFVDFNKGIKFIFFNDYHDDIFGFKKGKFDNLFEIDNENINFNNIQLKIKSFYPKENNYSNKIYNFQESNKKIVIYTCITGDYDQLLELKNIDTQTFDYICFTNTKIKEVYPWKIIDISNIQYEMNLSNQMFARYVKMNPHLFLSDYDLSIWINGNVSIIGDLKYFINMLNNKNYILTISHPFRNSIYEEINYCVKNKKDTFQNLNKLHKYLISEGFLNVPKLILSNIILRRHNENDCKNIMKQWWFFTKNYTKCENTTFNYIIFKEFGKYQSVHWDFINKKYFFSNLMHRGN